MKKIRFGSFPLTEIPKNDRHCLDKYLIKNFSDNISISDAMRNLNITKNLLYITPDSLMKEWLGAQKGTITNKTDRNSNYEMALKRAFGILKQFYKTIQHEPFYKEFVYYPIYIEKVEKISLDNQDQQLNYSFLILSNDLSKTLKIDEIRYDSNASINMLFLISALFPSVGINNLTDTHIEQVLKFYQFVEKSKKSPINLILDMWTLLGVINKVQLSKRSSSGFQTLNDEINKAFLGKVSERDFEKYRGLVIHLSSQRGYVDINDVLKKMFENHELSNLIKDVKSTDTKDQRFQAIYNSNKYQEIINVMQELIKFNKLNARDIIVNDQLDFDFSIENRSYSIETQSQVVAQQYMRFFKSFAVNLKEVIKSKLDQMTINKINTTRLTAGPTVEKEIAEKEVQRLNRELKDINAIRAQNISVIFQTEAILRLNSTNQVAIDTLVRKRAERVQIDNELHRINTELTTQNNSVINLGKLIIKGTKSFKTKVGDHINQVFQDADGIISEMANDLTFIYDDTKVLFTMEHIVQVLVDDSITLQTRKDFDDIKNGIFPTAMNTDETFTHDSFLRGIKDTQDIFQEIESGILSLTRTIHQELQRRMTQFELSSISSQEERDLFKELKKKFTQGGIFETNSIKNEIMDLFIHKVVSRIDKVFSKKAYKQEISRDKNLSELHPLIKKIIKDPNNFKSFIINYDELESLYSLWYILESKKFISGFTNILPKKYNNPQNRMEFTIENILKLKKNPVWVVSNTRVYLSMPDYLSLTGIKMLNSIDKQDLQDVCRISGKDFWNENNMGQVSNFSTKDSQNIKTTKTELDKVKKILIDLKNRNKGNKASPAELSIAQDKVNTAQEKYDKAVLKQQTDSKNRGKLNGFMFQEPTQNELLSPKEKEDLNKNKDQMFGFGKQNHTDHQDHQNQSNQNNQYNRPYQSQNNYQQRQNRPPYNPTNFNPTETPQQPYQDPRDTRTR